MNNLGEYLCKNCRPYFEQLNRFYEDKIKEFEERIEELEKENKEIKKRLLAYENAHTPPSKQRFPVREKSSPGKKGRPKGYPGSTRKFTEPDRTINLTAKKCPHCHGKLGKPTRIEERMIEDLPEPIQTRITKFLIWNYICRHCGMEITPKHKALPDTGDFGNNTLSCVSLMKFQDRLPYRKIEEALERQYGLKITPASILDFTKRVSDKLENIYSQIMLRTRNSRFVYVDETGLKVDGKNYWIWIFVTATETLSVVRKSRGKNVVEEVLGRDYQGTIICDGWKAYPNFTNNLQRCWAHLLREAKFLSRKDEEARLLSERLHKLFKNLKTTLDKGPPNHIRIILKMNAEKSLRELVNENYQSKDVQKFVIKIRNGANYWFNFVTNPLIEPTNNIAERALREHVIHRKIIGTLRNEKGTQIHERMMTCIATWKQHELNTREELLKCIRS